MLTAYKMTTINIRHARAHTLLSQAAKTNSVITSRQRINSSRSPKSPKLGTCSRPAHTTPYPAGSYSHAVVGMTSASDLQQTPAGTPPSSAPRAALGYRDGEAARIRRDGTTRSTPRRHDKRQLREEGFGDRVVAILINAV